MKNNKCNFPVSDLEKYYDDFVSEEERIYIEKHISSCSHCAGYIEDLKLVTDTIKEKFSITPDNRFNREIMEKIYVDAQENKEFPKRKSIIPFSGMIQYMIRNKAFTAVAASFLLIILTFVMKENYGSFSSAEGICVVDYVHAPDNNTLVFEADNNTKIVWVFDEGVKK